LCSVSEEKNATPDELEATLTTAFRRLIDSVSGRQIVVPLTAGNDSRLILAMLLRLNYSNVICYTVEGPGGTEWQGAHEATTKMGYPHFRIDMQDLSVRELCFADPQNFEQYYRFVGSYTNFCWLYDYVAIRFLESQHLLEKDAVFVPGHSGDTFAGSHLIKARISEKNSAADLTRRMVYIDFEYNPQKAATKVLREYFDTCLQEGYTPYSAYQNWVVQHRQAHNMVNSARAYDFCGYDVRLPLWDNALYDLFAHLPLVDLKNCRLYLECVQQALKPFGLTPVVKKNSVSWFAAAWHKTIKKILPIGIVRRIGKTMDLV
jgi:asparagine synthase (glutamine-hydrolysing)